MNLSDKLFVLAIVFWLSAIIAQLNGGDSIPLLAGAVLLLFGNFLVHK